MQDSRCELSHWHGTLPADTSVRSSLHSLHLHLGRKRWSISLLTAVLALRGYQTGVSYATSLPPSKPRRLMYAQTGQPCTLLRRWHFLPQVACSPVQSGPVEASTDSFLHSAYHSHPTAGWHLSGERSVVCRMQDVHHAMEQHASPRSGGGCGILWSSSDDAEFIPWHFNALLQPQATWSPTALPPAKPYWPRKPKAPQRMKAWSPKCG